MDYLKILINDDLEEEVVCNHPLVEKTWIWGGVSTSTKGQSAPIKFLSVKLKDGLVYTIEDDGSGKLVEIANDFINKLN